MNDKTTVTVNPDEHHILSATAEDVKLLAEIGYTGPACVLVVSRAAYHAAIDKWLDCKADYVGRYKHFCGVGNIAWEDAVYQPRERHHLARHLIDDGKSNDRGMVNVKTYRAASFTVEMEHG